MGLNLMTMCGAQRIPKGKLLDLITPQSTKTWAPLAHNVLVDCVIRKMEHHNLRVASEAHSVSQDTMRYFGLLEIESEDSNEDFRTVVGLRNSNDKKFPVGIVVGSGVLVCDNLCFSGEIKVTRKHTPNMFEQLPFLVDKAVEMIRPTREIQANRIKTYRQTELSVSQANDMVIKAFDWDIIPSSKIGPVLKEYRAPRHAEFRQDGFTAWRMMNSFTEIMKPRGQGEDLQNLPAKTVKLHNLLDIACGVEG